MKQDQLDSIIKLLDDPDEIVYRALENELLLQGTHVVKSLEDAWESSANPLVSSRIEYITHRIQHADCVADLSAWVESGAEDLFEASYIISRFQYPDIDRIAFISQLRQISDDVANELVAGLSPLETVRVLNHIIFQEHQFDRAEVQGASHLSFYMSNVLSQKKGNLFTLCLLYIAIAQSVNVPMLAVSLPENLAAAYLDVSLEGALNKPSKSLFYVNSFSKGAVFGDNEIKDFLQRADYTIKDEYFEPISNRRFVCLFLETMLLFYQYEKNEDKCHDLAQLIAIVKVGSHA